MEKNFYHVDPAVLSKQQALAAAGDDPEVLREICSLFLADLPRRLEDLRAAVQAGALDRVAYLAHSLRGSAALFGSDAAVEAGLRLELLARQGHREALGDTAAELEQWMRRLAEAVASDLIDNSI